MYANEKRENKTNTFPYQSKFYMFTMNEWKRIECRQIAVLSFIYSIPWLPNGRAVPFSSHFVRFAALLLAMELCGGIISIIAFNAPTRGNVTFFRMGKLFLIAYFWLTSRRLRRKPPSGNKTNQRRSNGRNASRK